MLLSCHGDVTRARHCSSPPTPTYDLSVCPPVHLFCLSLLCPRPLLGQCVCEEVCVCVLERRRAPWCDAFFIHTAVSFSHMKCVFIFILLITMTTSIHPVFIHFLPQPHPESKRFVDVALWWISTSFYPCENILST